MSNIVCKNCGAHFKTKFCPDCGQSATVHAINATYFLHDIPHSILHVDKGFAYTFKELLTRPGKTLREYLEGKRVKHFRPFAYVLLMATIYIFGNHFFQFITQLFAQQRNFAIQFQEKSFFTKYISIFFFLMIPVLSLTTWLFFKKAKYNFWEHFLVNTYLTAQLSIVLLLSNIYKYIKIIIYRGVNFDFTYLWFMIGFVVYIVFVFSKLIHPHKKGFQPKIELKLFMMGFLLTFIYATGMALIGIATPWW
jgi:hypothetical protein